MRNLYASAVVVFLLASCGHYTYTRTSFHPRQELMPVYPASAWDSYMRQGGAFRGLD